MEVVLFRHQKQGKQSRHLTLLLTCLDTALTACCVRKLQGTMDKTGDGS